MGGCATTHTQSVSAQEEISLAQCIERIKLLQQQMKHQDDAIETLRDALRKATASPIWTAPNKDEDM